MGPFSLRGRLRAAALRRAPARATAAPRDAAISATNDARIVVVILLLAAVALAWEMVTSAKI